ncbi:cell division protein FtsH, partial [candidate division KSB1 bacterium]|nr:cell division protein FtsH [candidate division KSB1 bacterium]
NCETMIAHMLGGRAAEWVMFKHLSTGAGNDIERTTELARKMVCEWGMSEKVGPVTYGKKNEEIFLGREITQHRDYSEQTAIQIDQEVRQVVEAAAARAEKIIRANKKILINLADALLEREIMDGDEIDLIMSGKSLAPKKKEAPIKPKKATKKKTAIKKDDGGKT